MTERAPVTSPTIYTRIRRFAPLFVVLFCIGILVLVGIISPFRKPTPSIAIDKPLVGADNSPTGAYMVLRNAGGPDTLLSASTPIASSVALQRGTTDDTTQRTQLTVVDRLEVPGFGELRLQPGSDQLLLSGLTAPLTAGTKVRLTLQFERTGTVEVEAEVQTYDVIADRLLPPRLKLPNP